MTSAQWLAHAEWVLDDIKDCSIGVQKMCPYQIPIDVARVIFKIFTKLGAVIFDPGVSLRYNTNACLQKLSHRNFIGFETYYRRAKMTILLLRRVLAAQILDEDLYIKKIGLFARLWNAILHSQMLWQHCANRSRRISMKVFCSTKSFQRISQIACRCFSLLVPCSRRPGTIFFLVQKLPREVDHRVRFNASCSWESCFESNGQAKLFSVQNISAGLWCFAMRHCRKGKQLAITTIFCIISKFVMAISSAKYMESGLCV